MIALTACGHALGGVRQQHFPDILKDRAFQFFKGNTTMFTNGGLSSLETFNNTCATLFERMINTVSSSFTLTDIIEPWDYKVGEARISVANDSDTLLMQTTLRLLDVEDNPDREVKLVWVDKDGSCSQGTCSSPATTSNRITGTTLFRRVFGKTALQYNFVVNGIDPVKSINKFWFEIDEKDGSQPTVVKNDDGQGYVISQDDVLFDIARSILYADSLTSITNFASEVVIAVKDTLVENGGTAPIHIETANSFITVPFKFEVLKPKLDTRFNHTAGYTFFSFVPTEFLTSAFDVYYGEVAPDNLRIQFGQVFEARNQVIGPLP
ncbi:hypothetical protein E1B28_011942 [Marasmius oreades]|uniref:Peroxidase n=1 Tax=Marasmius oreades TaxID=181124 RepID=A0A9P7RRD0_9AGAR|nr:uncharacterized protein E1B28_011942 [Marasmius oreades]KAG7087895.1 hypothetical protein E1B28_011942 [Marasmius oreades]